MMKKGYRHLLLLWLLFFAAAGCTQQAASDDEVMRLKQEVARLQAENEALKKQAATLAPSPQAAPTAASFTDIKGLFAEQAISNMTALGVFDQTSGEFHPNDPIKRTEFVRWLVKANNVYFKDNPDQQIRLAESGTAQFEDVPPSHPDFRYIQGMANAGYVIGYDSSHFKPDKSLTREEMIAIKEGRDQKGVPFKNSGLSMVETAWHFSDTKDISPKYADAIYSESMNQAKNIQRVYGSIKAFSPKKAVTRAEAALCLERIGDNVWGSASKALGK